MPVTRSTPLRPSLWLSALLVVASMVVAAPASAGWKTHPAPAFERAVIALRALDHQAVAARRVHVRAAAARRAAHQRLRGARAAERHLLADLRIAPLDGLVAHADLLVRASRERLRAERALDRANAGVAYARTLEHRARARRGVVLGGLSMTMRARVLRADRRLQRQAATRRAAVSAAPILLAADPLRPSVGAVAAPARPAASGVGAIAAAYALTQLGTPYRAAGMTPQAGFDCSGLLYWAFAQAGLAIPRSSGDIWRAGAPVTRAHAQPGDIVSFHGQGHVGLYLGHGLYVHATKSGDVVKVHAIADRTDLDGFVRLR